MTRGRLMRQQGQGPVGARQAGWGPPGKRRTSLRPPAAEGRVSRPQTGSPGPAGGGGESLLPHLFSDLQVPPAHVCVPARVLECCPLSRTRATVSSQEGGVKGQRSACPYLILAACPFPGASVRSYLHPLRLGSSYPGSGEMGGTRPSGLTSDVSPASSKRRSLLSTYCVTGAPAGPGTQ